jgi:hypothetical protein
VARAVRLGSGEALVRGGACLMVRGGRCGVWLWVPRADGREASGRYQDLSDTADRERGDTLIGVYNYLLNQLKLPSPRSSRRLKQCFSWQPFEKRADGRS